MALLRNPPAVIYPFSRPFLKWNDRVKRTQEAGIMSVYVNGEAKLFWKSSGRPVEPEQLYLEDEQEMVRRVRLPECRVTPKGPLLQVAAEKAKRRVPMSFFTITSKARMGAKRCTRRTITLRVKAALNLIVTRGAYYGDESKKNTGYVEEIDAPPGSQVMKFDEHEAESMGKKWILQGVFSSLLDPPVLINDFNRLVICLLANYRGVSNAVLETHSYSEGSFDDPQNSGHRDGKHMACQFFVTRTASGIESKITQIRSFSACHEYGRHCFTSKLCPDIDTSTVV